MPTITKPKKRRQSTNKIAPIKLTTTEEDALRDCLGWDSVTTKNKGPLLIHLLSYARARYELTATRPQPAHIVAELRPIHKAARDLSLLIEQNKLTHIAELVLAPKFRNDLDDFAAGVAVTMTHYKKQKSGGGVMRRELSEQLKEELRGCKRFFLTNAARFDRRDHDSLREFLNICKAKITA